jgi:hypothetical protein
MTRIRTTLAIALGMAVSLPALSEAAPGVEATAKVEITVEEAQEDDILLVIDLPIVIADARDAGVEEAELEQVLGTASDAGLSAGVTAELVTAETEAHKAKGPRKGLGMFVKAQIAQGVTGRELAAKIRDRKDELKEMTPEEREAFDKRVAELREHNKARKQALHEKRKELRAKGQEIKLIAKEIHDARKAELVGRKTELEKARKEHRETLKEGHDAREEAHEARDERREAHEDVKEAREDLKAADTPDERKEALKDLKDAKKDAKDAKHDAKDAKKDVKDAKKDVKDAKKDVKDAKHDAKDKKGG